MLVAVYMNAVRSRYYMDDHYSGTLTHGNVVVGYENGVFLHFGRDNNITSNLFIGTFSVLRSIVCDIYIDIDIHK